MNKREELIKKYAEDLKDKFKENVDLELLTKVTIGLGPSIYNADSSTVSSSDDSELKRLKDRFLIKKLGLSESDNLDAAIAKIMDSYGRTHRKKYRAVVYYLLVKHFNKEKIYS